MRHAKSAEENPLWTAGKQCPGSTVAFVCGCLFVRGNADSFIPPPIRRLPPITDPSPLLCSTWDLQLGRRTSRSRCLQRSSKRRKRGKMKRGIESFGHRRLVDCGRRFPGSVSACVYKGFGQNFPPSQSSPEIRWSPSLPPRHRHTLSVTLVPLPASPSSVCACILLYPAK